MTYGTPGRLTATTLLAAGLLLGQQSAAAPAFGDGGKVVCHVAKMRQESADLRARAARLRSLGATAEAEQTAARADALDRRIGNCLDAENSSPNPWP
ncbi:hypothetical protein Q5762_16635 [Streptomyces sp. P9(2023)]|uniref:hypothetical protein n=1 Tax=Streptomyces sp. P9(2023) TaxID=3064394 RepID=UPI0028F42A0A|nr:hypothetical protein [Streptomyces sp. P9(2023)]MDT9689939.1 hypothetical protein [Streptomyces sp. P9(2023)]